MRQGNISQRVFQFHRITTLHQPSPPFYPSSPPARQVMPKVPSAKPGRSEGAPAGDGSKPPRKRAAEKAKAKASANKRTKK